MMKWGAFFLGLLILAGGLIVAYMPLGYLLSRSGLGGLGVGWAQTQGTVTRGTISGLFTAHQAIGDVSLTLQPGALLSGQLRYRVDWGGVGGRGQGVVTVGPEQLQLSELRLRQHISAFESLMPPVRMIGGEIRLSDAALKLDRGGCVEASGQIYSDALIRLSSQYGRGFGPLEGNLSCQNGALGVSLSSLSELEDQVKIVATYSFAGLAEARIEVSTGDSAMALALSQSGFTPQNGLWVLVSRLDGAIQ